MSFTTRQKAYSTVSRGLLVSLCRCTVKMKLSLPVLCIDTNYFKHCLKYDIKYKLYKWSKKNLQFSLKTLPVTIFKIVRVGVLW